MDIVDLQQSRRDALPDVGRIVESAAPVVAGGTAAPLADYLAFHLRVLPNLFGLIRDSG